MSDGVEQKKYGGFMPVLPPRFALVELAVFALVIAAEYGLDGFPGLNRLNPHPYWIAVLLLSLQYGTVSGLLAAALAIGGSLLIGMPEAEIGESYFVYLVRVWTQPVLWIVVALLLGSFRVRQIEERHAFQQHVDDATVQASVLAGHARLLKARVDQLERRLAAAVRSPGDGLLNGLARLSTVEDGEGRLEAARAIMDEIAPGATWSLFAADAGGLTKIVEHGWSPAAIWRSAFASTDALTRAVVEQGRALSVLQSQEDAVLAADGVAAVPVHAPSGRVAGMLKIEAIEARLLDANFVRRLAVVAPHFALLCDADLGQASGDARTVVLLNRRGRAGLAKASRVQDGGQPLADADFGMATARPPVEPRG